MAESDLVLEFEIEEGRSPNLENVARALLAWNDAVQVAVRAIDPNAQIVVELVGVEHGSQRYKQIFRRLENFAETVEEGGAEYPLIFKHSKALGKLIAGAIVVAGVTYAVTPDDATPVLEDIREESEATREAVEEMRDILREDRDTKRLSQSFYEVLQEEPAFAEIKVFASEDDIEPIYRVPRSEFSHKSGLFEPECDGEQVEKTRPRTVTWEVVLVRPVLVGKPRRWTFARDGIEFSALMTDKAVLQALHDRTLAIPFAEGVMMQIEVTYRERSEGDAWIPITGSQRVDRVLSPRITLYPGPLFASADGP